MFICRQGKKKKKVQISSPVQGCESLPYWSDTGVSRDNLIQNGFAIKQQSFIPNKRLPLPARGERKKNPFPLVLKLEAGCCIMLGGPGSQVCSSGIRLVFAAAARTSLVEGGGGRCQTFVLSGITCTHQKKEQLKSPLSRHRFHIIQP